MLGLKSKQFCKQFLLTFLVLDTNFAEDGQGGLGEKRVEGYDREGRRRNADPIGHRLGQPADGKLKVGRLRHKINYNL